MSKLMKYVVLLTDVKKNKKIVVKKTRHIDEVEKWLASREDPNHPEFKNRDWEYPIENKAPKKKVEKKVYKKKKTGYNINNKRRIKK